MKIAVWVLNKTSQPPSLEATISRGGLSCQVTSFKAFYSWTPILPRFLLDVNTLIFEDVEEEVVEEKENVHAQSQMIVRNIIWAWHVTK